MADKLLGFFLWPLSLLFRMVVSIRRAAFRHGWIPSTRVGVPVVVVGNIAVGGTGKTPLVAFFIQRLSALGIRAGIVSRGYGRATDHGPVIVAAGCSASDVGDEPLLLARRTGVPVCVCADRVAAAAMLLSETDVEIIFSDDGLQHYRLQRDLEIVVIDGERSIGNGFMLPAGPLREPAARLDAADFRFINGDSGEIEGHIFELVPDGVVALADGSSGRLDKFSGQRVWALAGIGNPQRFYRTLAANGVEAMPVDVPDHGRISLEALRAEHAWPVLMTEKDAVKYLDNPVEDAWYVPVDVRMSADSEVIVMRRIQQLLGRA